MCCLLFVFITCYSFLCCSVFPGSHPGRGDSSHRHGDRSSHPGNHSLWVWQLHHPHHRPPSQHSDELQQGHGPGQRPGVYKCNRTDHTLFEVMEWIRQALFDFGKSWSLMWAENMKCAPMTTRFNVPTSHFYPLLSFLFCLFHQREWKVICASGQTRFMVWIYPWVVAMVNT